MQPVANEWETLRQFTNWWWRAGQPFSVPDDNTRRHAGSHEFIMYRYGQFQVEQVTLFPGYPVPPHRHPNVDTYECHLVGGGDAWVAGEKVPYLPSDRHHPKYRRLLIPAGTPHWGEAHVVNVALSFQHWLNGVPPTFITDDWAGDPWPE